MIDRLTEFRVLWSTRYNMGHFRNVFPS